MQESFIVRIIKVIQRWINYGKNQDEALLHIFPRLNLKIAISPAVKQIVSHCVMQDESHW
jgi:hypothetical protein